MRTKQEIFDAAWDWFVVQGRDPSMRGDGVGCAYLGENGARCAAGCLLPEELTREQQLAVERCEGRPILFGDEVSVPMLELMGIDPADREVVPFLGRLQRRTHDEAVSHHFLRGGDFTADVSRLLAEFCANEGLRPRA